MDPIQTIQLSDGGQFEIHPDSDPESPRDWDNLGTMVCFHRRYNLGDEHDYRSEDFSGWDELKAHLHSINTCHDEHVSDGIEVILPLFLMDHSGLAMRTSNDAFRACDSAGWDWGQVGWIYITKRKIIKEFCPESDPEFLSDELLARVTAALVAEVETYSQYLAGEVYGYIVRKPPCGECGGRGDMGDSCWGFYGSDPKENGMLANVDDGVREQVLAAV